MRELYRPEYCQELIEHMSKGFSYITWGPSKRPRISVSAMYEWEKRHPEWLEAKKIGYSEGLRFFETLLILKAHDSGKKHDMTAALFALRTRFHKEYGEFQKIDHTSSDGSLSVNFVGTDEPKKE
jgi:hypothetical protein